VPPDLPTLHADRGGPMKAKTTALMLADLGVVKSHRGAAGDCDRRLRICHKN